MGYDGDPGVKTYAPTTAWRPNGQANNSLDPLQHKKRNEKLYIDFNEGHKTEGSPVNA